MGAKRTILVFWVIAAVMLICSGVLAADTRGIDAVREKEVLNSRDLKVIDDFVAESVREMVINTDFTSVARIRTRILSRSGSSMPNGQRQYAEQFSESAYQCISEAIDDASALTPEGRRFKTTLNLLVLVDGLSDLALAELAINNLRDQSVAVRYWAVHCLTNPGYIKKLNSGGKAKLAAEIADQLGQIVESERSDVMSLITKFAAEVKIPEAEKLLFKIADSRIDSYADWSVDGELLDALVLKSLYGKLASANVDDKAGAGRRFGQLLSYVMQRYVLGKEVVGESSKGQLVSVMADVEKSCIGREPVAMPQLVIRNAIVRKDDSALLREHDRLLGSGTRAGVVAEKLGFDYGTNADGSKRISPVALSKPPEYNGTN